MSRRVRMLLAPLLVCVAAMGMASTADAAKRMEIAVADDNVFLKGLYTPFTGLRTDPGERHLEGSARVRREQPQAAADPELQLDAVG